MSAGAHRVLLLGDDGAALARLVHRLSAGGHVDTVADAVEAERRLDEASFDAVVVEAELDGAARLLEAARRRRPQAARVLVSADAEDPARGLAHHVVLTPLRDAEAAEVILAAIAQARLQAENARLAAALEEAARRSDAEVEMRTRGLQEALETATEQAVRDGLTGLYNHRFFHESLAKALAVARRNQHPVGLLFIDLDAFKPYNDTWGHPAGDHVLQEAGRLLAGPEEGGGEPGRASDIACRYGGDEFVLILPGTDREGTLTVAERLRHRLEAHRYATPDGGFVQLTVSIGVACFPRDALDRIGLVEAADRGLYAAKRAGRNCVRLDPRAAEEAKRTDGRP